jgi:hypothetical protein
VVKKGEPWGRPASAPPDREVRGHDRDLAAAVAAAPGALLRYVPDPDSDLARAVGLAAAGTDSDAAPAATELPMDVLDVEGAGPIVNMLVAGTPPDRVTRWTRPFDAHITLDGREWFVGRVTTIVVAVGQWRNGLDLVPRGHPGDGRVEVQAYALHRGERRAMRHRLASGSHLPHPRIATRTARTVEIGTNPAVALEVDGAAGAPTDRVVAAVRPGAYRLLV